MGLTCENLSFAYQPGASVLRNLSLEVRPGGVTGVFGPNGCGKSTLLRLFNGALRPQAGRVWIDDAPLDGLSTREIARRIAVVPQQTPADIPLTVAEMVMLGRHPHRRPLEPTSDNDRRLVDDALRRVDLAQLARRMFSRLSGGERQRTVIARALAQDTPILMMDEPTTHLDLKHQIDLYRMARDFAARGRTVVMVCHDLYIAPTYADHAILMRDGTVVAAGNTPDVLAPDNILAAFDCQLPWQP